MIKQLQLPLKKGFSLLEMLIVVAIIAILAAVAMPSGSGRISRVHVQEAISLIEPYKPIIALHYKLSGDFPKDNDEASLPKSNAIIGNYLASTTLEDGALHLELGNKVNPDLDKKILSIRPIYVPGSINSPVSWICGNDTVPKGMLAAGKNKTNVDAKSLPILCH